MIRSNLAAIAVVVATTVAGHLAGITINATPSMALGLWRRADQPLGRGVVVIACPPPTHALQLGGDRDYLGGGSCPSGYEPMLKPIAAMPGDTVTVRQDGVIEVNGTPLPNSRSLYHDDAGRPLFGFPPGTYPVAPGLVWLISTYSPRSFDSRYLGPVPISSIRGTVAPLWTSP